MSTEQNNKAKKPEQYIPITICPDCVDEGLQIDPRTKVPAYPVFESTCFSHLIIQGKIHRPSTALISK